MQPVLPFHLIFSDDSTETKKLHNRAIFFGSWQFFFCAGQRLAPHYRTLGDLEWEVESTTVTHSSADWWDLLLPLA